MNTKRMLTYIAAAVILGLAAMTSATAHPRDPDPVKSAKALLAPTVNPVVNVGSIARIDAGMMGAKDQEASTVGLVVDASGLTAVSRSALSPGGYGSHTFEPRPGMEVTVEVELTDVWLQLADGTRIEAEVVFTDPDLDLSFIRPIEAEDAKKRRFTPARLAAPASDPSVLDTTIVLSRLGKAAGWAPSVRLQRITAVLDTPWRCFAVDAVSGAAVFADDGRLLGLTVALPTPDGSGGMGAMTMGMPEAGGTTVVLPVSHFRSLIDQARAKPGGVKAPESEGADASAEPEKTDKKQDEKRDEDRQALRPGSLAPDFTLLDESGKRHSLSDYRGKHVLLDWWGLWCSPCVASLPRVEALHRKLADNPKVAILAMNVGDPDEKVAKWWKEKKYGFRTLNDADDLTREYGIKVFPSSVLIGPDGKVIAIRMGSADLLEGVLEKALAAAGDSKRTRSEK